MFNNVDFIGVDAVCNMIKQTDLKRFVIYRQGAAKGSTPVYDCTYTTNNAAAVKNFKDWATNICTYNPNNFLSYDILLFNDFENGIGDTQNIDLNENNTVGRKKGKIRFAFCLNGSANNYNQQQNFQPQSNIDIQGEIQKGIEAAMLKIEIQTLKNRINELENEEEEEEEIDIVEKVTNMISAINGAKHYQVNDTAINGEVTTKNNDSDTIKSIKLENINNAIKRLAKKDKNIDVNLLKLADLADKNIFIYNMAIDKLNSL